MFFLYFEKAYIAEEGFHGLEYGKESQGAPRSCRSRTLSPAVPGTLGHHNVHLVERNASVPLKAAETTLRQNDPSLHRKLQRERWGRSRRAERIRAPETIPGLSTRTAGLRREEGTIKGD